MYQSFEERYDGDTLHKKRMSTHMLLFAVCIFGALLLLLTFLLPVEVKEIKGEISAIEQIAQDWERRPFV